MQVPPCKQLISTKTPVSDLKLLPLFLFSKSHQTSSILTTYLKKKWPGPRQESRVQGLRPNNAEVHALSRDA